ncbi:hypothetical protein WAZ07_23405 [Bacillus sp. FJAT-51639]|uniref:LysR family transcriptional regulator n=1 Tax=Bacillus bruguierae TaxID=3127667 RepID=A0ABU8FN26_9BACI
MGKSILCVSANKLYQSEVVYKEICDSKIVAELAVAYRKTNINPELQEFLKIAKGKAMNTFTK